MSRIDFYRKLIRYILLMLMAIVVIILGNKAVTTTDCSECPGMGICDGKTDCSNY